MTAGERELPTDEECREQNYKRSEWLIETLIARDFDIPEFHALQVEIGARWRADRRQARAGYAAPPRLGALITLPDGCAVHAMHIAEISLNKEAGVVTVRTTTGIGHPIPFAAQPVAQPVAWEHNNPITGARFMTYEERPQSLLGNRELWNTRPLYAAPVDREGRLDTGEAEK